MSKKLKFTFLVSLVLNVLLVGVVLGELPRRFEKGSPRQSRMERALKELPEPLQTRFREQMERMRENGEPTREQMYKAREEALHILTTEPFNEAAYDQQVNKINELRIQMTKRMAEVVKAVAKDLPLEQRKILAKALQRPPSPPER